MAQLNLTEAQMLWDAINDPTLTGALHIFLRFRKAQYLEDLLRAVRQSERDTMNEARLAGMVEDTDRIFDSLKDFAKKQLAEAAS